MSEHKARVLLRLSHDARGRPVKIDEMRTKPALKFAYGSVRLDPGRDAIQSLDASPPVTGRVLLESDSSRARSLEGRPDRKSTRLNSSHSSISYAVFCLKKKKNNPITLLTSNKIS